MSSGLERSSLWIACHSSSIRIWMSSCQIRSAAPATKATSSSALHASARGARRDIGTAAACGPVLDDAAVKNGSPGRYRRCGIRARTQPPFLGCRENVRMHDPRPPQRVLKADAQDAESVDDGTRKIDLARIVEIFGRARNLADPHAERMRLHEHLVVEYEVLRVGKQRQLGDDAARESAVAGVEFRELRADHQVLHGRECAIRHVLVERHAAVERGVAENPRADDDVVYLR